MKHWSRLHRVVVSALEDIKNLTGHGHGQPASVVPALR